MLTNVTKKIKIKTKNLTLYLLVVVRKEGLLFPLNGCCIKKSYIIWLYLACVVCFFCFVFFAFHIAGEAERSTRLWRKTISVGMPIPRRESERKRREAGVGDGGGVAALSEQVGRILPKR